MKEARARLQAKDRARRIARLLEVIDDGDAIVVEFLVAFLNFRNQVLEWKKQIRKFLKFKRSHFLTV